MSEEKTKDVYCVRTIQVGVRKDGTVNHEPPLHGEYPLGIYKSYVEAESVANRMTVAEVPHAGQMTTFYVKKEKLEDHVK